MSMPRAKQPAFTACLIRRKISALSACGLMTLMVRAPVAMMSSRSLSSPMPNQWTALQAFAACA